MANIIIKQYLERLLKNNIHIGGERVNRLNPRLSLGLNTIRADL